MGTISGFTLHPQPTFDAPWFVSGLLFIPYLVWGVYLLRQNVGEQVQIRPSVEAITLLAVLVFMGFQYVLLKQWLSPTPWKLVLAMLALVISALALYGHLVVSLLSYGVMSLLMPTGPMDIQEPRYGAAEGCERQGDFEGAAREYETLSRMFPKDARSALRAADNLSKVGRMDEAADYFERGFRNLDSADQSLSVVFRLVEVYTRELGQPAQAKRVMEEYLRRYPDSERADAVRARLARMGSQSTGPSSGAVRPR